MSINNVYLIIGLFFIGLTSGNPCIVEKSKINKRAEYIYEKGMLNVKTLT